MKNLESLTPEKIEEKKGVCLSTIRENTPRAIWEYCCILPIALAPAYGLGSAIAQYSSTGEIGKSLAWLGVGVLSGGLALFLNVVGCAFSTMKYPSGETYINFAFDGIETAYRELKELNNLEEHRRK